MNIKYSPKDYLNIFGHTAMGISFLNWLKVLNKNRWAIGFRYLPKALFLTGNVFFNIPFQWYEKIRYDRKIRSVKVEKPIFVLGHLRSGTTYLHHVLCKDPGFSFCATHEVMAPHIMLTFGEMTRKIMGAAMPETRPMDNVRASSSSPMEEEFAIGNMCPLSLAHGFYFPKRLYETFHESVVFSKDRAKNAPVWQKHFDYFIRKVTFKYPGRRILFKSPANTARVKEILELYPDARFIHIHRDPYRVFLSTERLFEKILPILGFHRVKNQFVQDYILYSYEKIHQKFLKDKALIPEDQIFEMSYSEFVGSPLETLRKAYQHLDLGDFDKAAPFLNEEVRTVEGYQKNTYADVPDSVKSIIDNKWGFMFDTYGYEKNARPHDVGV